MTTIGAFPLAVHDANHTLVSNCVQRLLAFLQPGGHLVLLCSPGVHHDVPTTGSMPNSSAGLSAIALPKLTAQPRATIFTPAPESHQRFSLTASRLPPLREDENRAGSEGLM
jgi:hypothetical protein